MNQHIDLSPRLQMVAGLVPAGAVLADVGTDHAYLPTALIIKGHIPRAIAADLRSGPLDRARVTARTYGVEGQISFRLCDGLSDIKPDEVGAIAIAGMGGETIAAILQQAPWTREQDIPLVLQPMSSMYDLRLWLCQHGYQIIREELAQEGDTLYTALLVGAGSGQNWTAAQLWAGKNNNHPLRGAWLDQWLQRTARALAGLAQSRQEGAQERQIQLKQVYTGLEEMKKEWEAWQLR